MARSDWSRAKDARLPLVSVVIPVKNCADLLVEQLAALDRQSFTDFEVIVSDNGSTDGLENVVDAWSRRTSHPVVVIDSSKHPGVSHARNVGVAAARSNLILVCDADDVVAPNWVERLVDALDQADLVGGGVDLELLNRGPERHWRTMSAGGADLPVALDYLPYASGFNVGVHRRVVTAIGGWDENLVAGGDDVDFSWRAQMAGFTLRSCPDAVVNYRLRRGLRSSAKQAYRYGTTTGILYTKFVGSGLDEPSLKHATTAVAGRLRHFRALIGPITSRGQWVFYTAYDFGHLVGVLRYRARRRRLVVSRVATPRPPQTTHDLPSQHEEHRGPGPAAMP